MKNLGQVFLGIIVALASIGLLLGGFSLSLAEGHSPATATLTSSPTLTPTSSPTWQPVTPSAFTTLLADSSTPFPTQTPTLTLTLPPPPTYCPPPLGWLVYFVQPGETIDSIAVRYQVSSAVLQGANCLLSTDLLPGVVIYVPPMHTQTPLPCGQPYSWVVYYVQPGDTLYRLSLAYGISVAELQRGNCLGSSTLLHNGQLLYVPPGLPLAASPTPPGLIIPTSTPLDTSLPGQPSDTPQATSTTQIIIVPTDTPVPVPSDTPAEVPTDTPVPTNP